eukprot:scaffold194212_cov27-Tisochrysis_lutea.AAC.2
MVLLVPSISFAFYQLQGCTLAQWHSGECGVCWKHGYAQGSVVLVLDMCAWCKGHQGAWHARLACVVGSKDTQAPGMHAWPVSLAWGPSCLRPPLAAIITNSRLLMAIRIPIHQAAGLPP